MSDTVPASAIVASLAGVGPSFVLDLGTGVASTVETNDFRVSGATYVPSTTEPGTPLLVDFFTWVPASAPPEAPPTLPGAGAIGTLQDTAPAIAGGIGMPFDQLT